MTSPPSSPGHRVIVVRRTLAMAAKIQTAPESVPSFAPARVSATEPKETWKVER